MNTKFNFRQETLKNIQCPESAKKQFRLSDTKVRGLHLRITPNGSKQYIYRRRLPQDNESAARTLK